jgi:hypothetical protein
MERAACAGCGHTRLDVFADLGATPLADTFPEDRTTACGLHRYPLRAASCGGCGLVQLLDVVPDEILYGTEYGFRTGASPSSLAYMAKLAQYAHEIAMPGLAVEIGSNDGTLLADLRQLGREVLGIDPSGASYDAAQKGLRVIQQPFTADLIRESHLAGRVSVVVAANVAAHVASPHDFFEGLRLLLGSDGIAVVEFQYLLDLLAGCMFDLIYHEHRFFYSLGSFAKLAEQHGLGVQRIIHTPAQGGSLRVVLGKAGQGDGRQKMADYEDSLLPGLLAGFQARVWYAHNQIAGAVFGYPGEVWGYAASAKSCTLLNYCDLGPMIKRIVDVTPGKIGRFAPGTGIPICAPGEPFVSDEPDAYLLLASNYLKGILDRERNQNGYKGEFIVPLPLPVIV